MTVIRREFVVEVEPEAAWRALGVGTFTQQ